MLGLIHDLLWSNVPLTPSDVANRHLLLDDLQGVVQHFLGVAGRHAEADAGIQQSRGGGTDPHHCDPPLIQMSGE